MNRSLSRYFVGIRQFWLVDAKDGWMKKHLLLVFDDHIAISLARAFWRKVLIDLATRLKAFGSYVVIQMLNGPSNFTTVPTPVRGLRGRPPNAFL